MIIEKSNCVPLICPSIKIKDYNIGQTNPAIFIEENGDIIVLIRLINYVKFKDYSFKIIEYPSTSNYYIGRSNINNIDNIDYTILKYDYNLPVYNTYWRGIEDIRFIDEKNIILCVPELSSDGNPSLFTAEIKDDKLINFIPLPKYNIEKNWMPFSDKYIYSISPLKILSKNSHLIKICDNLELNGYHGSSNGIIWEDGHLFLIHKTINNEVFHIFFFLSDDFNQIKYSDPFKFYKYSYIEFVCSLQQYNNKLYVSLGVNDSNSYIITLDKNVVKLRQDY